MTELYGREKGLRGLVVSPKEIEHRILEELNMGMKTQERLAASIRVESSMVTAALKKLTKEYLVKPSKIVYPRGNKESALILYRLTPAGIKKLNSEPSDPVKTPDLSVEAISREIDELDIDLLDTDAVLTSKPEPETERITGRRKKGNLCWRLGLILIIVGVVGFAGFSWLHDILRVPIVGQAFDEFGSVNRLAVLLGVIIQIFGISLLFLSEITQKISTRYSGLHSY